MAHPAFQNNDHHDIDYRESEILLTLHAGPGLTQRELAERLGLSLGFVNRGVKALKDQDLLDGAGGITEKAISLLEARRPRRAVILAAGYGMRMVPVSNTPKALLEVRGERLIERQIRQLRAAGVTDIRVVIGYRKEEFEYLSDRFGVTLTVNPDYALRNNLHSLALAASNLENCYVVPCDLWCRENPFRSRELCSWYALSDEEDPGSDVRLNRKGEAVRTGRNEIGSRMVGIAYLCGGAAERLRAALPELDSDPRYRGAFWEEALYLGGDRMTVPVRVLPAGDAVEINTYEQLRELDAGSGSLQAGAMAAICRVFGVREGDITDIRVLKKGMTNRSFMFTVNGAQYIMRIPGEGTEKLINRRQEAAVYAAIRGKGLCDDPVYLDPETGYKITRYLPDVRVCDPGDEEDLRLCMTRLREFHAMRLEVSHDFDVWAQIDFYESLWPSPRSLYRDYRETKEAVLRLRAWRDAREKDRCLTHIDAVCDNFLFSSASGPACETDPHGDSCRNPAGTEKKPRLNPALPQLTDWEYAGMADPHTDLAMFAVYSNFSPAETDRLIDIYFENACPPETRIKIHCYAAACGLLWSNWCEYKSSLGVEFGEYSLQQYRAAKTYSRLAAREIAQLYGQENGQENGRQTGARENIQETTKASTLGNSKSDAWENTREAGEHK